jgi:ferric-dicitrate binding protein FerR (iron transport regulator)
LLQQLSEEESAEIVVWLQQDKANQDFLFSLEELYWAYQMDEMRQLADTNQEWKKLESKILQGKRIGLLPVLKYAAIIILALSLPYTAYKTGLFHSTAKENPSSFITVTTEKGGRSQITLPDDTKVWLNSCSSLTYNTNMTSDRQIQLTGEAYFEVSKDEHRPFTVSTPLLEIQVLGTKFNLRAFNDEDQVQTTLYEGQIAAHLSDSLFKQDVVLHPGEQLTYRKNKTVTLTTEYVKNDRDWKDGAFYFRQQSLQTITHTLERSFNVEITIADWELSQEKFTCEFKNGESLSDILRILKLTKKLDYTISGSNVKIFPAKI